MTHLDCKSSCDRFDAGPVASPDDVRAYPALPTEVCSVGLAAESNLTFPWDGDNRR